MSHFTKAPILITVVALALLDSRDEAITTYRGPSLYLSVLGTNIKFPTFTKEFTEGGSTIRVGGVKQLFLESNSETLGFRLSRERIRPNGSGLGFAVTYWRGTFDDAAFLYKQQARENFIAEYHDPTHTYLFLDLHFILIPWESGNTALGLYGLISLVGDREAYRIERYTLRDYNPTHLNEFVAERAHHDLRFAFGFGNRFYILPRISLWFEKRWIVGERFSVDQVIGEGGLFEGGRSKTLYVPFNSIALSLAF